MAYRLGANSLRKLAGVHPSLVAVVKQAIKISEVDFAVTDGKRTQAQQDALYAQGRTKPGQIVTWTKNSKHITGRAVDLAPYIGGKIVWEPLSAFTKIHEAMAAAAKELDVPVEWGGDWARKDRPHFQLKDGWAPKAAAPATKRAAAKAPAEPVQPIPAEEVIVVTTVPNPKPKGLGGWLWGLIAALGTGLLAYCTGSPGVGG